MVQFRFESNPATTVIILPDENACEQERAAGLLCATSVAAAQKMIDVLQAAKFVQPKDKP